MAAESTVKKLITGETEPGPAPPAPRWVAPVFVVLALGLIPWTVALAMTLPAQHGTHHYGVAWTGFDIVLAASLAATGIGAFRRATWLQSAAAVAATLLLCDAWFDVLSSTSQHEVLTSVGLALFVELPVALACLFVARHAEEAADRAHRYAGQARRPRRAQASR